MRRNRWRRRIPAAALGLALGLAGCAAPAGKVSEDKVTLTVLMDTELNNMDLYWAKLASEFPDVKLEVTYLANLAPDEELARQVAHGDVADLVFSENLNADIPGLSACFMDLSGKPYTSRYQTSYLNGLDVDGRLYCLPADLTVQGIIYNKTMFDELGLEVPGDYRAFEELCARLREAGLRPGVLATGNQAPAQLFARAYAAASPHSLGAWKWAEDFNAQAATAREGDLAPALELLRAYEKLGFLDPEDFTTSRWEHRHVLADRVAPMLLGDASTLWQYSSTDEFCLMPFFSPADGKGYFFTYPLIRLAVGKQVSEDPAKAEVVDRIFEYITSEEGQRGLVAVDKGLISPILGMQDVGEVDFYQAVKDRLTDEALLRLTEFPRCADALGAGLEGYLWGALEQEELCGLLDAANRNPQGEALPAIAVAEEDFTLAGTNALALEAMSEALNADLALLRQRSKGSDRDNRFLCGVLYKGPVTETDLLCIHPMVENPRTSNPMLRVEMTGAQLLELLSYEGAYYYNGVTVRWQRDKDMGTYTAQALLDKDGREIAPEERFTVAVLRQTRLREDQYLSQEETGVTLWAALEDYMQARGRLAPFEPNPAVYGK